MHRAVRILSAIHQEVRPARPQLTPWIRMTPRRVARGKRLRRCRSSSDRRRRSYLARTKSWVWSWAARTHSTSTCPADFSISISSWFCCLAHARLEHRPSFSDECHSLCALVLNDAGSGSRSTRMAMASSRKRKSPLFSKRCLGATATLTASNESWQRWMWTGTVASTFLSLKTGTHACVYPKLRDNAPSTRT
jgi:hypothetical protein